MVSNLSQFTTTQKTGVLYDFSVVKKARFYEFKKDGGGYKMSVDKNGNNTIYYAQINPNEIKLNKGQNKISSKGVGLDKNVMYNTIPAETRVGTLEMELKYDIYDEYMARSFGDSVHINMLDIEKDTSLGGLLNRAYDTNYPMFFKWGYLEFFGVITEADVSYSAYSMYGQPLKANLRLKLTREGDRIGEGGKILHAEDDSTSGVKLVGGFTAVETADDILLHTASIASQARR